MKGQTAVHIFAKKNPYKNYQCLVNQAVTCSQSTIETLEHCVKAVKIGLILSRFPSGLSVVDFEILFCCCVNEIHITVKHSVPTKYIESIQNGR